MAAAMFAVPSLIILAMATFSIALDQGYCGFKAKHDHPCPTCGMTRAYRAMTRGQLAKATAYHPFAAPLFAFTVFLAGAGSIQLVTGRPVFSAVRMRLWWWLLLGNGVLVGWLIKIAIGRARGLYPLG
jgi:hypothetical protein